MVRTIRLGFDLEGFCVTTRFTSQELDTRVGVVCENTVYAFLAEKGIEFCPWVCSPIPSQIWPCLIAERIRMNLQG